MDTDKPAVDATSIWDERYEKGEHVGSKQVIEGDPTSFKVSPPSLIR